MGERHFSWDNAVARNSSSVSKDSGSLGNAIGNPASKQAWPPARGSVVSCEEQMDTSNPFAGTRVSVCTPVTCGTEWHFSLAKWTHPVHFVGVHVFVYLKQDPDDIEILHFVFPAPRAAQNVGVKSNQTEAESPFPLRAQYQALDSHLRNSINQGLSTLAVTV